MSPVIWVLVATPSGRSGPVTGAAPGRNLILGTMPGIGAPARRLSRRRAGSPECSSQARPGLIGCQAAPNRTARRMAGLAEPPTHSGMLPPAGLGPELRG
jgi:hypothetical protein